MTELQVQNCTHSKSWELKRQRTWCAAKPTTVGKNSNKIQEKVEHHWNIL